MGLRKYFLVFFIIIVASMAVLSSQQKSYPVVTATKDGVKTVMNPEYPRDGRFIAKLTAEMSCGEEAKPEMAMLNKPINLKVDDQGRIYVMDWGDVHIKVYDSQGRFLRTIGRKSQGPGEFDTPPLLMSYSHPIL